MGKDGLCMAVLGFAEAAAPILEQAEDKIAAQWVAQVQTDINGLIEIENGPDYIFALDDRRYLENLIRQTKDPELREAYTHLLRYY